ncbi:muddled meiosis- protein [Yamadazyma tenuis]|nr:muddled meiosis- protein [Yamadazyma tenuis]
MGVATVSSNMGTYNPSSSVGYHNEIEKLKMQLNLKTQMVSNLQKKLTSKESKEMSEMGGKSGSKDIPITNTSFYELFKDVSTQLAAKTKECNNLKTYLESVLISLSMNGKDSSHEDLIHKVVNKINCLSTENEKLMQMICFSNKSNLLIEVGILRNEVQVLKEKLRKFDKIK